MNRDQTTRRTFLMASGLTTSVALAGCQGIVGSDNGVQDTDGDGVIDSEDYAPRDPDVQRKEQLTSNSCQCETDTPAGDEGTSSGEFSLDFENPPAAFADHIEMVDQDSKVVLRGETVEFSLPDLSGWQRIEYKISGQGSGNTKIAIRGADNGGYSSFVGIRPWMRFPSAVDGFDGANTYPDYEFEDVQPDTEYRVVIERTGGATGQVTVYGPDEDELFRLPTETVFGIYQNTGSATFRPSTLLLRSNKQSETAIFDDIIIR